MRIVLTAGGSGGHIFPAKSISDVLEKQGHTILFITDERGRAYTKYFPSSRILDLKYYPGRIGRIKLIFNIIFMTLKLIPFLYKLKPHRVVGFGGYPSMPAMLAAQFLRIPTIIHEQNVHLGKANRWLAKNTQKIIGSFTKTPRSIFLGNPVREVFLKTKPYTITENFNILILGGSQGSKIFNSTIPKALKKLPNSKQKKLIVTQQCREEYLDETNEAYKDFQGQYHLQTFFENVAQEMEKATIVITRAGGSTIAELCATGRPSILIPFSASKEGDQYHNSLFMKNQGASFVFSEYHFDVDNLYKMIYYLMDHREYLMEMSRQAKALSKPNAISDIVDFILKD